MQAFDFVAEDHADRKIWLPLKQIHGVRRRLDCGDPEPAPAQSFCYFDGVPIMLPGNGLLSTQSRLGNRLFRWPGSNSAKKDLLQTNPVGGTKECANVIHAADIVEQNHGREMEPFVARCQ